MGEDFCATPEAEIQHAAVFEKIRDLSYELFKAPVEWEVAWPLTAFGVTQQAHNTPFNSEIHFTSLNHGNA